MSTDLIGVVIEQGWNLGDVGALDEVCAPDYYRHLADGRSLRGREEFKAHILATRAALPGLHLEIHFSLSDGPLRTTTFTFSGTRDGAPYHFDGALVAWVEGGRLAEAWEYFNRPRG